MSSKPQYRKSLIIWTVFTILAVFALYLEYLEETKGAIRMVLESRPLYGFLWITIVVIFLFNYFTTKSKEIKQEPIFTKQFGEFADKAIGGISYGTIVTTALTLLKGIYIQSFFKDIEYFKEFNDLDLVTIFAISAFLLYNSTTKIIEIAKDTYRVSQTEIVKKVEEVSQPKYP